MYIYIVLKAYIATDNKDNDALGTDNLGIYWYNCYFAGTKKNLCIVLMSYLMDGWMSSALPVSNSGYYTTYTILSLFKYMMSNRSTCNEIIME
jgi:hypothetical protein